VVWSTLYNVVWSTLYNVVCNALLLTVTYSLKNVDMWFDFHLKMVQEGSNMVRFW